MCGITGIFAFNLVGKMNMINVTAATGAISKRGPDHQGIYHDEAVALGHRRLSIIDTRDIANQPMWDDSGRYCIIYNGEVFNFRTLRQELEGRGTRFNTASDTEVILQLYIALGARCLEKLNGFFAFCIYDKQEQVLFLARDQFGIKPLLYLFDEDKFIFASEMKAILQYGIEKPLDTRSLLLYLQLNYIPSPHSMLANVGKLEPGHYMVVRRKNLEIKSYYSIPYERKRAEDNTVSYDEARQQLAGMLEESVKRRLGSDVPLGAFLSGGIDSSIIAGLASRHQKDFHTFSIGFRDEKFFDETEYAKLVASHFGTSHTVFTLSNADMFKHVESILDYIDEPFADSSAIAVYILSKETRRHATVALSGDGADEILGGYNKHAAAVRMISPGLIDKLAVAAAPLARVIPHSRNNTLANKARQLQRFAEGYRLRSADRYWHLASLASFDRAKSLLRHELLQEQVLASHDEVRSSLLRTIPEAENLNDILLTDMRLVLPNDMLVKVDMMSMANGLEVRPPFLDPELVRFAFTLPPQFKIGGGVRKRILQDAFRDMLPARLYNRPKKGFEVPMLGWLRREMKPLIEDELLTKSFVEQQGIFNYDAVAALKKQLNSSSPGDAHARIWGLVVFQWWWRKWVGR
jgi:asparagine synthase (glutamine-hydrolysing)